MPSTIYLTLGPDVDAGHFAWRHLRSHVVPALNQRFARVGVEVQIAQGADQVDESHDHVVTIAPYSVDDLAKPNRDVVEEIAQLIAAESLEATISGKIGYVLAKNAFLDFKKRVDYSEYGGGPLLGVRGVCIICHGRSNANAIKNAIRVAKEFAECRVSQKIENEIKAAAQDPAVQRIFVNAAIKKAICREAKGDRTWLEITSSAARSSAEVPFGC